MVSIIIPNYNKSAFLRHSLDSVLAQTSSEWEAICVDDCSTDNSPGILREYAAKDVRIKVIFLEKNRGGNYARNLGAAESRGEYLIFLDSDDALAEDCIAQRIAEMEDPINADRDMLVFPMQNLRSGCLSGEKRCKDAHNALLGFLRHDIPWQTMMPIWRRRAFEYIGGFDESYPRLQDVELYARALLGGLKYGLSKRVSPDCLYTVDECRQTLDNTKYYEMSVSVMTRFVKEIRKHILMRGYDLEKALGFSRATLVSSLEETLFSAVRGFCDACQAGRITARQRNEFSARVWAHSRVPVLFKLYLLCYRIGINQVKGFNFLYRRIIRVVSRLWYVSTREGFVTHNAGGCR